MAQLFDDERKYPDNKARVNFVFLGYPYSPPLALDDYRGVVQDLEQELPLRLWYFLDEVTTAELMRKVWRAILRADLVFCDVSGGNPNVAFELGLAVAENKNCLTLLKSGEPNPLGVADLGYAERVEYTSAATLKEKLREVLAARSSAIRVCREISYEVHYDGSPKSRVEIESAIIEVLNRVYRSKRIVRGTARSILQDDNLVTVALNKLRERDVLQVEGERRGARWVFTDSWVTHDHEVVGA